MSIQPQGEDLRKATKWLGMEMEDNPKAPLKELIQKACIKFDLSPLDADFLTRYFQKEKD
jgi:hypothetical protein